MFLRSPLVPKDLVTIPGPHQIENRKVLFMGHKRFAAQVVPEPALKTTAFKGDDGPVHMDTLQMGAILANAGILLEYEMVDGACAQSTRGKYLRHPFTGVGFASHLSGGSLVLRSAPAFLVPHADLKIFVLSVIGRKV